jgi:hypothetical protein
MINSNVRELNDTRVRILKLEEALTSELASLPSSYGFDSVKAFVAAIKAASGRARAGRQVKPGAARVRRRAKITDAVRDKVKKLVRSGKTGASIATTLGISLPSVQNIKKASGLVKARKKASPKPKARRPKAAAKAPSKARKGRSAPKRVPPAAPKPSPATPDPAPAPAG